MVAVRLMPGMAASSVTQRRVERGVDWLELSDGGETKMSACSTSSSQSTTVWRKLPIMTPTPMMTLTATMSAATATAMRLSERVDRARRHARDDAARQSAAAARRAIIHSVSTGVSSAAPMTMAKRPPKVMTRFHSGMSSSRAERQRAPARQR